MDLESKKRFLNYCCVTTFLSVGKNKLHEIFCKRWYIYKKQKWVDGGPCNNQLVKLSESATSALKGTLSNCILDRWDITTTNHAIKVVSEELAGKGLKNDRKEDEFLHAIRVIRNELTHMKDDSQLSDDEFKTYMSRLRNAYKNFGINKTEIYEEEQKAKFIFLASKNGVEAQKNGDKESQNPESEEDAATAADIESESEYETCESEPENLPSPPSKVEVPSVYKNGAKHGHQSDDARKEFERLKEEANKFFKAKDYLKAITIYNQLLQLPNLSHNDQATIFSNRSGSNLLLKTSESVKAAKEDAEWAIQLWPSWWKGYYRLARTQIELHDFEEAKKSLEKSLALNNTAEIVSDELSFVKSKLGILSREEHLKPGLLPPSDEEQISDIQTRFGLSRGNAIKMTNKFKNAPATTDVDRGNRYRDGNGCSQDYVKAAAFYAKAAKDGDPEAMYNLGKLYNDGTGVKRDYEEAFRWLTKAATSEKSLLDMDGSGIPEAQHLLGMKYYEGVEVKKDLRKAFEMFEKAFNNGLGCSANNIGMMYKNGEGVEKSGPKAFQWFKASANLGDTQGMQNLAYCYFCAIGLDSVQPTQKHIAEGMKLLKQAGDSGDMFAEREYERRKNHTYQHFLFDAFGNMMFSDPSIESDPMDMNQHKKDLKEAVMKGSTTAQRMLNIYKNLDLAMEAFKKNDGDGVIATLSKAIRINPEIVKVPDLFKSVVEAHIKTHSEDLDTVICYIQMNATTALLPSLLDKYFSLFPDDECLLEMHISKLVASKRNSEALKLADKALQLHPKSLRFLYLRAECLFMQEKMTEEAIKALDAFLTVAPKDHEKVPACHYRKSRYYQNVTKNIQKYLECFEAGLAAEKKQLSCFMPYKFPHKDLLQKIFEHEKKKLTDGNQLTTTSGPSSEAVSTTSVPRSLELIKQNPQRKLFILQHREGFAFMADKIANEHVTGISLNAGSELQKKIPKSLARITLKDIDPKVDKVYDGFILKATIIEFGFLVSGMFTLIEDENGDVQKLAIYNWPSRNSQILDFMNAVKTLRPNVKVSIINPYMRMAASGQSAIKVENPDFIKLDDTNADNKCSCCGNEATVTPCKNCSMSRYCSPKCQKYDLDELNHLKVCEHLKMCSKFLI